jgi:transposase-like protein
MSRSTISTFKLFELFPNQESARLYLESRIWPDGVRCPFCAGDHVTTRKGGYYRCNACDEGENFTIRTNTVMERSKIPLHKWVYAMYLLVTARKGISSMQVAKEIGVTQKTAWFMLSRLREACGSDDDIAKMSGTVEVDECFVGGTEANKHAGKKLNLGRGPVGKTAILGLRERRGGRVVVKVIADRTIQTIQGVIFDTVHTGSTVYSDDHIAYSGMDGLFYSHDTINHSIGEYARGPITTNSVESVWAVLKRGIHGVYHQVSKKHLDRYVDEFAWRLNQGNVARHTLERLDSFAKAIVGKRITYQELIAEAK